jgi:hypothetical protein
LMASSSGNVSEAMAKVADSLKLDNTEGITAAGAALDALGVKGKASADQIRQALADALKGEDLLRFQTQAQAAFDGSEQGARRLKAAVDAVALESLRRAGTSVRELETGFSLATTSAINDVDALTKTLVNMGVKGDEASRVLSRSLDKALETSNTEKAVKAVIERLEQLGKQGLLTGDQLTAGLEKAKQKLDEIRPGVNSLDEALRAFGIKTASELKNTADQYAKSWEVIKNSTTTTLAQKQQAFLTYAQAAIASNGGVADSTVKAQAAMLKLKIEVDETGKVIAITGAQGAKGIDNITTSAQRAQTEMRRLYELSGEQNRPKNQLFGIDPNAPEKTTSGGYSQFSASGQGSTAKQQLDDLKRKEAAGTLSAADLDAARKLLEAATYNKNELSPANRDFASQREIDNQLAEAKRLVDKLQGGGPALAGVVSGQPTQGVNGFGGTVTININTSTSRSQVNVASRDDADTLTNVLRELADGKARAA